MSETEKQEQYTIKILSVEFVTHNVRRFKCQKPSGFSFTPGQATELSINKPSLVKEKRPFTFTCLPSDNYLEFTIKMYPEHEDGITKYLKDIKPGETFIIREPFGAIHYKGPGVFIAGGAGITPFISILRMLRKQNNLHGNTLIFSNKTELDIINREELEYMSKKGLNLIFTVTREKPKSKNIDNKRINLEYLKEKISNFNQHFYICGPPTFVGELQSILKELGAKADSIIIET